MIKKSTIKQGRIPFFLELVLTVSQLLVLFVAIIVALASFLSGQDIWRMVIQVGIAVLTVGFLVWLFTRIIFQGMLDATIDKLKEQAEKEMEEAAEAARIAVEEAAQRAEEAARLAKEEEYDLEENSDIIESDLQL